MRIPRLPAFIPLSLLVLIGAYFFVPYSWYDKHSHMGTVVTQCTDGYQSIGMQVPFPDASTTYIAPDGESFDCGFWIPETHERCYETDSPITCRGESRVFSRSSPALRFFNDLIFMPLHIEMNRTGS